MSSVTNTHESQRARITVLLTLTLAIALLHFLIPTASHALHKLHIVVRKLYSLPPVMAAAWFGVRGATWTTLGVSGLFILHAAVDWPGNYMEQANQAGELIGFWVAGLIPGYLFDRQRAILLQLASAHKETLQGLVSALDLREHQTAQHSQRVREYTLLLADRFDTGEQQRRDIGYAALLHDVGKIAVPDRILLKHGALTEAEQLEMRKHPETGYHIVRQAAFLRAAAEIVYAHHERFDGSGYPRGLQGADIPFGARLFAVADVYDAITSERPYRSPMSPQDAVHVIRDESPGQFDPVVVSAFVSIGVDALRRVATRLADIPPVAGALSKARGGSDSHGHQPVSTVSSSKESV
jgi:putative nucleotidyltransferase with HDIG domain